MKPVTTTGGEEVNNFTRKKDSAHHPSHARWDSAQAAHALPPTSLSYPSLVLQRTTVLEQPQHIHLCRLPSAPSLQAVNSKEQQLLSGAKVAMSGTGVFVRQKYSLLLTAYSKFPSDKAWLRKNISKLENRC